MSFQVAMLMLKARGSAAKGTGIYSSDYDFYIRMDNTIVTTTKKQRIAVSEQLRSCLEDHDIHYTPQLKGNCIHLHHGSAAGSSLPDIDVISQRFKGDTRKEPNNKPMAAALPMVGELVRYIKQMPHPPPSGFGYTHIVHPTGFWVEQFAVRVERELSCSKGMKKKQLTGSRGFAVLLEAGMEKIARRQSVTRQQQQALEEAGMWNDSWRQAANRVLNK